MYSWKCTEARSGGQWLRAFLFVAAIDIAAVSRRQSGLCHRPRVDRAAHDILIGHAAGIRGCEPAMEIGAGRPPSPRKRRPCLCAGIAPANVEPDPVTSHDDR